MKTPVSEYQLPRALEEFDFGPQPIPGVAQTQVPSMLGTLASAGAAGIGTFANMYKGKSSFEPPSTGTQVGGSVLSYSLGKMSYNG